MKIARKVYPYFNLVLVISLIVSSIVSLSFPNRSEAAADNQLYYWSKYNVSTSGWSLINDNTVASGTKLYKGTSIDWGVYSTDWLHSNAAYYRIKDYYKDGKSYVASVDPSGRLNLNGDWGTDVRYSNYSYPISDTESRSPIRIEYRRQFDHTNEGESFTVYVLTTDPPRIKGTLIQENIKAVQGTYPDDGIADDGFWYVKTGIVPNSTPNITVTSSGDKSINLKAGSDTFTIIGAVSDADNDTLSVGATIGGVTKQVAVSNTATSKSYSLVWRTSEFNASGTYKDIVVTVDDGRGGVATANFNGKLTVDKTALYYWDKYTVYNQPTSWALKDDGQLSEPMRYGLWFSAYGSYTIENGVVVLKEYYDANAEIHGGRTMYGKGPDGRIMRYYLTVVQGELQHQVIYSVQAVPQKIEATGYTKTRGSLVASNIQDIDKTYPDNGIHTDSYWYVKKATTNMFPVLTVDNSDVIVNKNSHEILLKGSVMDADNDNVTITATISGISKSVSIKDTSLSKTWQLKWTDKELEEGIYSGITISADDGKDGKDSIIYSGTILIDQTAPVITMNPEDQSWTNEAIDIEVHFKDTLSGMNPNERKYKITTTQNVPKSWDTADSDKMSLTIGDEGQWYVHAKGQDFAGNETYLVSGPYQLQHDPKIPELRIIAVGTEEAEIGWTLPNSSFTEGYQYNIENLTTGKSWTVEYPVDMIKDEGLAAGTIYQYRVKAVNYVGETEWSEPTKVLTLPAAPEVLSVQTKEYNSQQVEITFDAVPSADKYILKVFQSIESVYERDIDRAGSHIVTGLEGGKQYTATVVAVNSSGQGKESTVGFLTLPAAPGEFKTALIKDNEIELNWNSSETAIMYDLHRFDKSIYTGPDLSHLDTGLESSTSYDYKVSAKNENGFGDIAYLTDLLTLPSQVPSVTVDTYSSDGFDISWQAVKGTDGYGITLKGKQLTLVDKDQTSYRISGLSEGTVYNIGVYAYNGSGVGKLTTISAKTLPGQVTDLKVDNIGETDAEISWNDVLGADKYRVSIDDKVIEVSSTKLKLLDLVGGETYKIRVEAGNGSGYGSEEQIALLTLPQAPNNLRIKGNTATSVQLLWDPVLSASEYSISEATLGDLGTTSVANYSVNDLTPGEVYTFRIKAINASGEGSETPFIWQTVPASPGEIEIESVGVNTVSLMWDPVSGAETYRIKLADTEKEIINTDDTKVTIDGLESAMSYSMELIAVNSSGGIGEARSVPVFVTLPSHDYDVKTVPSLNEIKYELSMESNNEIVVISYKSKEVYRGMDRQFTLSSLPAGSRISVSIWTENEIGDSTEPKKITDDTSHIPTGSGNGSNNVGEGSNGNETDGDGDLEVPDTDSDDDVNGDKNSSNSGLEGLIDIEGLYNKGQVMSLYNRGIVKGVNNKFEPRRNITRAEFMSLIVRALDLQPKESREMRFEDINQDSWYYKELKVAFANHIVKGFSETEFRPNDPITREQASKMLSNALGNNMIGDKVFKDQPKISHWAEQEVKSLASLNIVQGYPDGTFKPKNLVNRAEGAAFIYKFIDTQF